MLSGILNQTLLCEYGFILVVENLKMVYNVLSDGLLGGE